MILHHKLKEDTISSVLNERKESQPPKKLFYFNIKKTNLTGFAKLYNDGLVNVHNKNLQKTSYIIPLSQFLTDCLTYNWPEKKLRQTQEKPKRHYIEPNVQQVMFHYG